MKIYTSGSMEKVPAKVGLGWRSYVKDRLSHLPITVYNPYDFEPCKFPLICVKKLVETDKLYILKSDLVIVNTEYQGVGTPQEVLYAYMNRIPVWMFGGSMNPWYLYHVEMNFCCLDSLLEAVIKKYNSSYADRSTNKMLVV